MGNKKKNKNYGTFIGVIIELLEGKEIKEMKKIIVKENKNIDKNDEQHFINICKFENKNIININRNEDIKPNRIYLGNKNYYKYFNPLEYYKKYMIFHKEISKYYINLNQQNFQLNYNILNDYLIKQNDDELDINKTDFLTKLKIFKNFSENYKNIIKDSKLLSY